MQKFMNVQPAAAEEEKARRESVGVLKERSSMIPRAEGGLNALLTRYLDKRMGQYEKSKGVSEAMQKMLSKMEWVVVHVRSLYPFGWLVVVSPAPHPTVVIGEAAGVVSTKRTKPPLPTPPYRSEVLQIGAPQT